MNATTRAARDSVGKVLFLIPARGGSKGFPGKNLAVLGGAPLVGRAVRTAQRAAKALGWGCRVVCSTDDAAIAEAARTWGAEVPFMRPSALATDGAKSLDVVRHALEALGGDFEMVVLMQATSPLTEPEDVLGAVALHRRARNPVVSVCQAQHPVEWHFRLNADQRLVPVGSAEPAHQRQLTAPSYRPNGAIYVASARQVRSGGFWTSETLGYVMPAERSVDVDSTRDLGVARAMLESRPVPCFEIAGRKIGPGQPCFMIAEAGVNHNGSLDLALKLVDAAAEAGADAVKFQTFKAERLVTPDAPKAEYQLRTTGKSETQFAMLKRLELDQAAHRALMARCMARGVLFLSTPFDEGSCDLLDVLGVPAFKLPSGELTNPLLLQHVARKGKPIIMSTGMATLGEVADAVDVLRQGGCRELALLHCVSNYPADPADANLRAMKTLSDEFHVPVGFSDHTEGDVVALASVALGACIVEKHFTLDRGLPGPDHQASVEPDALTALVERVRMVESAMGNGQKALATSESPVARVARRSLVAAKAIPAGTVLSADLVTLKRPGTGLPAQAMDGLVGKRAVVDISDGTLLTPEMFE